jgi:leader peptidase (prepilin peptidase)/N-methyltransferase
MFGLGIETLFYLILISSLIVITFIDLDHKIIPNAITYPGIAVGILYGAVITDWGSWGQVTANYIAGKLNFFSLLRELPILDSIFGVILGAGTLLLIAYAYKAVKKRDGMGMGDVKLLAMIGAFFGWEGVLFAIFLGSILGSVFGIAIIVSRRGDMKYALPFGPFLSIAAVIYIFTGGFKIFLP